MVFGALCALLSPRECAGVYLLLPEFLPLLLHFT